MWKTRTMSDWICSRMNADISNKWTRSREERWQRTMHILHEIDMQTAGLKETMQAQKVKKEVRNMWSRLQREGRKIKESEKNRGNP